MNIIPQNIPFHASPVTKSTLKDVAINVKTSNLQIPVERLGSSHINTHTDEPNHQITYGLTVGSVLSPKEMKEDCRIEIPSVYEEPRKRSRSDDRISRRPVDFSHNIQRVNLCRSQLHAFEKEVRPAFFGYGDGSLPNEARFRGATYVEDLSYSQDKHNYADNSRSFIGIERSMIDGPNESFNATSYAVEGPFRGMILEEHKEGQISLGVATSIQMDNNLNPQPRMSNNTESAADQQARVQAEATRARNESQNRKETGLFLRRCTAFFFILNILSLYGLLALNGDMTKQGLITTAFIWFTYVTLERIVTFRDHSREIWQRNEDKYCIMDYLFVLLALVFVQFKVAIIPLIVLCNCVPFFVIAFFYYRKSGVPLHLKKTRTVIRFFYGAQVALAVAKANGTTSADWRLALAFIWIYFALCVPYCLAFLLVFILILIFAAFRQGLYVDIPINVQIIGVFWYCIYYGLISNGFLVLVGLGQLLDASNGVTFARNAFIIAYSITAGLTLYSLVLYRPLSAFLRVFNPLIHNTIENKDPNNVTIQVEVKQNYFIMKSSTYFQPIKTELLLPSLEKVKELRAALSNFRFWGKKNEVHNNADEKPSHKGSVDINTLRQYKEKLDGQFSQNTLNNNDLKNFKRSDRGKFATFKGASCIYQKETSDLGTQHNDHKSNSKNCLSDGDIDNMRNDEKNSARSNGAKDDLCYICCVEKPNAILMNCGHGGICYKCAVYLIKKKNECMECRGEVHTIVKVEKSGKNNDLVKGIEVSTIKKGPGMVA